MKADRTTFLNCSGALLLLDYGLKYSMTNLRVNGSKGENDPNSFFEKLSKVQLLTAEYVPQLIIAMGLNQLKTETDQTSLSTLQLTLFKLAVVSRYIFALRAFDFKVDAHGYANGVPGTGILSLSAFGVVGATVSYLTYAGLLFTLFKS